MTTLTATSAFTIENASTITTESVPVTVISGGVGGGGSGATAGSGRLIHPTFGTYDYDIMPFAWRNMSSDAIIPPVWQSTMTLSSYANTLWKGELRDVIVQEIWQSTGGLSMRFSQLNMMIMMWTNPPDPASTYVQWYPNYINTNGYNVILLKVETTLSTGGPTGNANDIELDAFSICGYVSQAVTLTMRVCGKL
jgi:hypothetical protein